ncbi:MAG: ABC transporter permease, partial [Candidatus Krumholzibacteria bacterium]|nr:ABC transporter permease [Candidatus Krumholzibacteria bacterium]
MSSGDGRRDDKRDQKQVWVENFKQALDVIRTHKMRSSLLIVGVAIGVTTVLAMVTVMSGLSVRVQEDIISANKPYLFISRFDPFADEETREKQFRRKQFTFEDADAIAGQCKTVEQVDLQIDPGGRMRVLRYEAERTNLIQVVGTSENFGSMYSIQVGEGRFFTGFEVDRSRRVVVLGYGPASDLFPNRDPVGKRIRIGNFEYEVVGALKSREHIMGSIGDNFACVPYTTFEKDMSGEFDDYQIG